MKSLQLPIDTLLPEIVQTIERNTLTLLEAEPGAGKTTRVPPALIKDGQHPVFVLEPRRLAARMAAQRVAAELKTRVGDVAGYQVRFERVGDEATRLWFMTEGVLTNRLLSDRPLPSDTIVVLDEFHERHLETDLALALLRRLTPKRPDIRVLLMSATLRAESLVRQLNQEVPIIQAQGRVFPLEISYTPASSLPLEERVANAVGQALAKTKGHVLVFLPGAAEIRRSIRASEAIGRQYSARILPLYGDLASEDQDAAVAPSNVRKVICSTNVAESSITIDGVTAVVDSGLARIVTHSPWTGIARLDVIRISRSSCTQRAGRAGRTGPGSVIRLYTEEDFRRRPEDLPIELLRADLAQLVMQLAASEIAPETLPWLDAPPVEALLEARRLLRDLQAMNTSGGLTKLGSLIGKVPVHPRLAALAVRAAELGDANAGCTLAAILATGKPRLPEHARNRFHSDVEALVNSDQTSNAARASRRQLVDLTRRIPPPAHADEHALEKAVLLAFPDRVMRKRGETWLLATGGSAQLDRASTSSTEFAVALEIDGRSDLETPLVRLACPIEPNWLLDLFPDRVEATETLRWNRDDERVEQTQQLLYRKLVIDESCTKPEPSEDVQRLLVAKALELGLANWKAQTEIARFLERIDFAKAHSDRIPNGDELLRGALHQMSAGAVSLTELRDGEKNGALLAQLQAAVDTKLLDELAPAVLALPSGRRARVDYTPGKPPSVASRLQDFIGLKISPAVARGQVPLVLELLAPNGRPVQVTTDLNSFWKNLYPQIRKELSRRYPRHSWPEAPQ